MGCMHTFVFVGMHCGCVYQTDALDPRSIFPLLQIHKASAMIIEPAGESDNPLRFTSGLVVALDVDATLEHVQDPQNTVKVQVCPAALSLCVYWAFASLPVDRGTETGMRRASDAWSITPC